jgi:hypothetical protein
MYTYKRFKTSKWDITIVLLALVLVIWGILGLIDTPLAKKREEVTFELEYVSGPLAFDPQPLTISRPIPPGSTEIGDHGVVLDLSHFGDYTVSEAEEPGPLWEIEQVKRDANRLNVRYWFTDAGSGVKYCLYMPGTFASDPDNWLPAPGSIATVTGAEGVKGVNWKLSPLKGKYGVDPKTGYLDWTLKITRPD